MIFNVVLFPLSFNVSFHVFGGVFTSFIIILFTLLFASTAPLRRPSATISSAAQLAAIEAAERRTSASNTAHKARPLLLPLSATGDRTSTGTSSRARPPVSTPTVPPALPLHHDASSIRNISSDQQQAPLQMTAPDSVTDTQMARIVIPSNVHNRGERPAANVQSNITLAPVNVPVAERDSADEFAEPPRRSTRARRRPVQDSNFDFSFNLSSSDENPPNPPERPQHTADKQQNTHTPRKGRKFSSKGKGKELQRSGRVVGASTSHHVSTDDDDFEEVFTSQVMRRRSRRPVGRLTAEECDEIAERLMSKIQKHPGGSFFNCNIKELHFH